MASRHSLTSLEWLGSPLPAELERATKKVKRKDVSTVSWRCSFGRTMNGLWALFGGTAMEPGFFNGRNPTLENSTLGSTKQVLY
ncbi:hypothetical protein GOBAR_AA31325 [Gossypium barbadense]|uniref:Uncharacterized protein n=1 Tax=Gossypium barbadense TaxID=3634 RepID=A0A2P5WE57_GOSBA|nr:hypothetical protein GOBAR_AA31325 [Gossypium barbadense]